MQSAKYAESQKVAELVLSKSQQACSSRVLTEYLQIKQKNDSYTPCIESLTERMSGQVKEHFCIVGSVLLGPASTHRKAKVRLVFDESYPSKPPGVQVLNGAEVARMNPLVRTDGWIDLQTVKNWGHLSALVELVTELELALHCTQPCRAQSGDFSRDASIAASVVALKETNSPQYDCIKQDIESQQVILTQAHLSTQLSSAKQRTEQLNSWTDSRDTGFLFNLNDLQLSDVSDETEQRRMMVEARIASLEDTAEEIADSFHPVDNVIKALKVTYRSQFLAIVARNKLLSLS